VPDLFLPTDRLITLDVNHDGEGDVVAYRPDTGEWSVYLNENPDLAFGRPQRLTIGGTTSALMTGDIILGAMP
jgi:hypothetical protein